MMVKSLIGPDAGQLVRVRDDIGRQMIADGRAEDPYAEGKPLPPQPQGIETQTRKPPQPEKAVRVKPFTADMFRDFIFGKPSSKK